jgi:hypothetical protein
MTYYVHVTYFYTTQQNKFLLLTLNNGYLK